MFGEGGQVRTIGIEVAGLLVFGQFDGILDLYRFQIEGLAAGNHVLEEAVGKYGLPVFAQSRSCDPGRPAARTNLAARFKTGKELPSRSFARAVINFFERLGLFGREAAIGVVALAGHGSGIKTAGTGIVEDAVLHSIIGVAGSQDSRGDRRNLPGWNIAFGIALQGLDVPDEG